MVVVESTADTLAQYAEQVLAVAVDSLNETEELAPAIAYTTASAVPSFDCCPSLIVRVARLAEAPTSPVTPPEVTAKRANLGAMIMATYVVTILRCAANPVSLTSLPSAAEQMEVARVVQQDGWMLWNGLRHAYRAGEIFDACLGVHFDSGVPIREQGGCVGWEFTITANIPGIPD